jgi:membrane fusion protein (multidrug efflux system)
VIVARGLEPGERVIVEGLQKVRPGMQVKPEMGSPAGTAAPPPAGGATPAPATPATPPAAPKAGG